MTETLSRPDLHRVLHHHIPLHDKRGGITVTSHRRDATVSLDIGGTRCTISAETADELSTALHLAAVSVEKLRVGATCSGDRDSTSEIEWLNDPAVLTTTSGERAAIGAALRGGIPYVVLDHDGEQTFLPEHSARLWVDATTRVADVAPFNFGRADLRDAHAVRYALVAAANAVVEYADAE